MRGFFGSGCGSRVRHSRAGLHRARRRIDAAVHCAAVTDFNRIDGSLEDSWLLSSGFAEGKPGQHILTPTMRGVPADGGITVSGVKKPCGLTWSMNLMSASVAVADPTQLHRDRPAGNRADPGRLSRHPARAVLADHRAAAAESDQVAEPTEVFVPEALIFYPQDGESMDPIQARGFVWFEPLISVSYLGAATNLAERAIARGRGPDEDRASLAIELETMTAALEQVASATATAGDNDALLARGALRAVRDRAGHRTRGEVGRRDPRRHVIHRVARNRRPFRALSVPSPSTRPHAPPPRA